MSAASGPGPTKVLYCIDALARGGTELQLTGLIARLDRRLVQPHLLTLRPTPPELAPADCPLLVLDVPRLASPRGLRTVVSVARQLRRGGFGAVQTFFQDATIFGGAAARLAGVPVRLASFRDLGFWRDPRQEWLMRRTYPLLTGFVANSRMVRDHFAERDGLDPARIRVIPNGVDVAALPFVDHTGPTTEVGIVGNVNRQVKRIDLFVRAAGIVAQRHPQVRWHVVGDGQLRPAMEALAAECGLGDRIVFAGRVADVPAYLQRLQVGVLCSDSEGFSNALLEYMFKGCAAVATDVGGNAEALEHDRTGLLVPVGDAEALAAALTVMIEDVPRRRRLAAAARHTAETTYGWDRCVAAHLELYRRSAAGI